jgi:hypothetical protein
MGERFSVTHKSITSGVLSRWLDGDDLLGLIGASRDGCIALGQDDFVHFILPLQSRIHHGKTHRRAG